MKCMVPGIWSALEQFFKKDPFLLEQSLIIEASLNVPWHLLSYKAISFYVQISMQITTTMQV